jgi:hypothetical protein
MPPNVVADNRQPQAYVYDDELGTPADSLVTQLMGMYQAGGDAKAAAASFLGYITRVRTGGGVRGPALHKKLAATIFAGRVRPMLPRRGQFRLCARTGHLLYFSHLQRSPSIHGAPEEVRFVVIRQETRASEPGARLALSRHDEMSQALARAKRGGTP